MNKMNDQVNSAKPLLIEFGKKYNIGINPDGSINDDIVSIVLIETCFKKFPTFSQMTAFLVIAKQYNLNPFTKDIIAYSDKNGLVPVVSVDGWCKIINAHPLFSGMSFRYSEQLVPIPDNKNMLAHIWCECLLYRKDLEHPVIVREYMGETYKSPIQKQSYSVATPWQSHPNRMLRHKTLIQAARYAFNFSGILDQEEADQIKDNEQSSNELINLQSSEPITENVKPEMDNEQSSNELINLQPSAPITENVKPEMDNERFERNYFKAKRILLEKLSNHDEIIQILEKTHALTDIQRNKILNIRVNVA